jgi:hypothetical protein
MQIIEQKIKKLYGGKASFCAENGYKYKDFASKLRTVQNRINWLNDFLFPLNLEIHIVNKKGDEEGK